jgi:hypothetical protein
MGPHIIDGEFQSDKYPTTPRGKVPLSVKDKTAQDLLWEYARRRRSVDAEFSEDLEMALLAVGFQPPGDLRVALLRRCLQALIWCSGSADFQTDGKAFVGWEKHVRPLIEELVAVVPGAPASVG